MSSRSAPRPSSAATSASICNSTPASRSRPAPASGAALRGSGILGVNQGAGLGNQQINAFRLSVSNGPESLDDSVLAQSVALTKVSGSATPVPGGRSVSTDDRAFAGSSGVVQVNQSAGVGNQSMNTLSVRVME